MPKDGILGIIIGLLRGEDVSPAVTGVIIVVILTIIIVVVGKIKNRKK